MSYDPIDSGTGASGGIKLLSYGEHVSNNSAARDDRLTTYRSTSQESGSAEVTALIQKRIPQTRAGASPPGKPAADPARRDAVRRGVQKARREADAMLAAAGEGELTRLSNKAFELRDTLQDLWAMRDDREDDWGDLLNLLQIALEMDEYEKLTPIQCKAVRDVIADHLSVHVVDIDDIEETVKLLRRSGLDPFGSASPAAAAVEKNKFPDEIEE
jgi:hypothetical protein